MAAERDGAVDQLVGRHDLVDVADLRGGLGVETPAVEHPLQSLVGADEPHEALRSAAAGREAEHDLRLADDVIALGHQPVVAGQRELCSDAERRAVERGDEHGAAAVHP